MGEETKRNLQSDEYFCSSCGEIIKRAAEICPKCGVRMKSKESGKSKTVALILAFFLGGWTWVYTWKTDQYKFATVCFLGVIAFIGAYFESWNGSYPLSYALANSAMLMWIGIVTWAWALILASIRPESFYKNYGEDS